MGSWKTRHSLSPRIFERPLGITELGFYWDSRFQGTADTVQHAIVQLPPISDQTVVSSANVVRTWRALKHQYPLLGSYIEQSACGDDVSFVVAEDRLDECGPEEVTFQKVSSLAEAQKYADDMINGERILSDSLLARIAILSRADTIRHIHVLVHIAHCITDGMANATVLRSFLDILSSSRVDPKWSLEDRLALSLPSNELIPAFKLNQSVYRWQRAIGQVLAAIRLSKISGGHTLPRRYTHLTPFTPARSGIKTFSFPSEKSSQIIDNCRRNNLTFGNVYPVIAQIALTRLLCRKYIQGEITSDEWEYRRREPMVSGGPLSLRPFLDREWYQMGGSHNVSLAIGFFFFRLPYMPLGSSSGLSPGDDLPGFLQLLSFERFLLRCRMIKKQSADLIKHPLFLHISTTRSQASIDRLKGVAEIWRSRQGEVGVRLPLVQQSPVLAHGGSSLGNVDSLLPRYYPLVRSSSTSPSLLLSGTQTRLRCRPAELYLGASMTTQQLHIIIFWDMNVYEESTISEWLDEVKEALEAFLGEKGSKVILKSDARL